MATGRTVKRYSRFYADGYDLSGYTREYGPLEMAFDVEPIAALNDAVKNVLVGHPSLSVGNLNGIFDNTAGGLHAIASIANGAGIKRIVMCPIGIRAIPTQGDPVFAGEFEQKDYKAIPSGTFMFATVAFDKVDSQAAAINYKNPWGILLHPNQAETAINTAIGIDDNGASSALGGFMCYQIFTANGTATVKIQDAATNLDASFADLSGATSGSVDASVTPKAGIVALSNAATVRQYLRWQIVLGTATTVTFALSFHRAKY